MVWLFFTWKPLPLENTAHTGSLLFGSPAGGLSGGIWLEIKVKIMVKWLSPQKLSMQVHNSTGDFNSVWAQRPYGALWWLAGEKLRNKRVWVTTRVQSQSYHKNTGGQCWVTSKIWDLRLLKSCGQKGSWSAGGVGGRKDTFAQSVCLCNVYF